MTLIEELKAIENVGIYGMDFVFKFEGTWYERLLDFDNQYPVGFLEFHPKTGGAGIIYRFIRNINNPEDYDYVGVGGRFTEEQVNELNRKLEAHWNSLRDKSYWTKCSAVIVGEYFLYINTGNEDWALFRGKNEFMADEAELISPQDGKPRKHNMGLMETLMSCGIHGETLKNLLTEYIDFLS